MKKPLLILALALSSAAQAQSPFERAIVTFINKFRVESGLDTLVWSGRLERASAHHAEWMRRVEVQSHHETVAVRGLKCLKLIDDRFREYGCTGFNENIAVCPDVIDLTQDAAALVECWKRSAGHRANLLFSRAEYYTEYDVARSVTTVAVSVRKAAKSGQLYIVMNIGVEAKP